MRRDSVGRNRNPAASAAAAINPARLPRRAGGAFGGQSAQQDGGDGHVEGFGAAIPASRHRHIAALGEQSGEREKGWIVGLAELQRGAPVACIGGAPVEIPSDGEMAGGE